MMKTKTGFFYFVALILLLMPHTSVNAQGVAVNNSGTPADSSAIFDASSTTQGVLVPRMTTAQRNAILSPANGLLIYNITTDCFNFYKNGGWFEFCGDCVQPPLPSVSANGPLCEGDSLKLTASFVPGVSYSWTGPGGFTSNLQNPVVPNATVSASGQYLLTVTNNVNCSTVASPLSVIVHPVPSASFSTLPSLPAVNLSTTFNPAQSGANTYNWTFQSGNPAVSTQQNPSVIWNAAGTYSVTLSVTHNGCSASQTSPVVVANCTSGTQTFNYTGSIVTFTVPATACPVVTIEVWGAQGGNSGGLGARMRGDFTGLAGQTLKILVGGEGANVGSYNASGGGGSFVTLTDNTPLIIAGGGGGNVTSANANIHASTGTSGMDGYSIAYPGNYGQGGTNGNGGGPGGCAAAGGGLLTDGAFSGCGYTAINAGKAFVNGGAGGNYPSLAPGGFGGGGGGGSSGGGGGGGYSGGGGSYHYPGNGGGGGSYNSGTNQSNSAQARTGNGMVVISW